MYKLEHCIIMFFNGDSFCEVLGGWVKKVKGFKTGGYEVEVVGECAGIATCSSRWGLNRRDRSVSCVLGPLCGAAETNRKWC